MFKFVSMYRNNNGNYNELINIFCKVNCESEMKKLFDELFTDAEIKDIILRWALFKDLKSGKTQREIAKLHKISLCKITRGSKLLKDKNSIINHLFENGAHDERCIKS